MSKVLKNNTVNTIVISDTGVSIPASPSYYVIPPQDYLLWSASSDIVTEVGNGNIIVNDGSYDLSISDGIDLIKGLFPAEVTVNPGNTPNTTPWLVQDDDSITVLQAIAAGLGVSVSSPVFKKNEAAVTSRNKVDLANTEYTVPTGKKFVLTSFCGSYDAQAQLYIRLEKQTGGVGAWETMFRLVMMSGGQGNSTEGYDLSSGITIGQAGDKFKITIEGSIAKGTVFAEYSGSEY